MKKLILALVAICSLTVANAQQPKSILLYGNVGFTTTNTDANNNMTWNVNPGVGYQFNDHWTVGVNLGWSQNSTKESSQTDRTSQNLYNAGAFLRYSHYIGTSNFFWYGQFDASYTGTYTTVGSNPATAKATGFSFGVTPAIGLNIGKGYAVNFNMGDLSFATAKADGSNNTNSQFNFGFGTGMMFGLSKNFACHCHKHAGHEPGDDMHKIDTSSNDDEDEAPKKKHHKHHDEE